MINLLVKDLMSIFDIDTFIETGTYKGDSLNRVISWFPDKSIKFYSIDINHDFQKEAKEKINDQRVTFINDSSDQFLMKSMSSGIFNDQQCNLFFLDAHWNDYCPLRDEISQILKLKKTIIVIDDFSIPFNLKARFDAQLNGSLCWNYIKHLFKGINYRLYYPKKLSENNTGIAIIFIGYSKDELQILETLPLYKPLIKGEPILPFMGWIDYRLKLFAIKILKFLGFYEKYLKYKYRRVKSPS